MERWEKDSHTGDGINTPVMTNGVPYTGPLYHPVGKVVINFVNGIIHDEYSPALVYDHGREEWWAEGKRHRLNGPAIEGVDGTKVWYRYGKLHREDGPALDSSTGSKEWWVDDIRHRLNGPAIEHANGSKIWYVDGICHRLDGPAYEWADGSKEWYVDGEKVDIMDVFGYEPHVPLTEEQQMILRLMV